MFPALCAGLTGGLPLPYNVVVNSTRIPLFAPLLTLVAACAGSLSGSGTPTPQDAARAAFDEAEDTYESANYLEAIREFQQVRTRHPYSTFAALAELRVADSQFEMGKYMEAVESYRAFVRFHPHHDRVVYAEFRIGESYFKEMPEDWFFMPPAYEKDQAATRDAVRALERFLDRFGESDHAGAARERLTFARQRLADHEMYVANFYLSRDRPEAAVGRLEVVAETYRDIPHAAEALLILGQVYLDTLEQPAKAVQALERLLERYPDGDRASEARALLDRAAAAGPQSES